jgi:hypothetical protein
MVLGYVIGPVQAMAALDLLTPVRLRRPEELKPAA